LNRDSEPPYDEAEDADEDEPPASEAAAAAAWAPSIREGARGAARGSRVYLLEPSSRAEHGAIAFVSRAVTGGQVGGYMKRKRRRETAS
jgi:hypothetical protein